MCYVSKSNKKYKKNKTQTKPVPNRTYPLPLCRTTFPLPALRSSHSSAVNHFGARRIGQHKRTERERERETFPFCGRCVKTNKKEKFSQQAIKKTLQSERERKSIQKEYPKTTTTTISNNLLKLFHFISFHFGFAQSVQTIEAINVKTEMEMLLEIDGNGH